MPVRDVVILGSTGSVGTQALDVIAAHPQLLRVVGLAAGGNDVETLARQATETGASIVGVAKQEAARDLHQALESFGQPHTPLPTVIAGPDAAAQLGAHPCDVVLNGITGSIGLAPTLAALRAGATLALANKESLVAGGSLVTALARPGQIIPVDSEHSALAQALRSGADHEVRRLILTASGGPFRGKKLHELHAVTPEQALAHPTWNMGPVITINSATLMNKALELIEAHELFAATHGLTYDDIDVVVHPQSMIHSMVEFCDGSTIAQASSPDMRLPIGLALTWPHRLPFSDSTEVIAVPWAQGQTWQFHPLDDEAFPAIALARHVGNAGGCLPAIFNAANEECVAEFLAGRIRFTDIVATVHAVIQAAGQVGTQAIPAANPGWKTPPGSVGDVLAAEMWGRTTAHEILRVAHHVEDGGETPAGARTTRRNAGIDRERAERR